MSCITDAFPVVLFFPQKKGESMGKALGKFERYPMILNSVACMQIIAKKFEDNVGFSTSSSESDENLHYEQLSFRVHFVATFSRLERKRFFFNTYHGPKA